MTEFKRLENDKFENSRCTIIDACVGGGAECHL